MTSQTQAMQPVMNEVVIASVGRRFAAWVIDLALLLVAVSAVAALLGGWHSSTVSGSSNGSTWTSTTYYIDSLWSESLLAILSACYVIPSWSIWGATLGQRVLSLRALDEKEPRQLNWWRAAVRWLILFGWAFVGIASYFNGVFSVVAVAWLVILLASTMRDSRKQGLHDQIAGSLVVARFRQSVAPPWVGHPGGGQ
jgi:uncharacterized RDD family membrane protein YckC